MLRSSFVLQCFKNEFGCQNGECIALSKRCDGIPDCENYSDEKNCKIVFADEELYRKDLPPLQAEGKLIPLWINLEVIDVGKIDETEMTIAVKLHFHLEW